MSVVGITSTVPLEDHFTWFHKCTPIHRRSRGVGSVLVLGKGTMWEQRPEYRKLSQSVRVNRGPLVHRLSVFLVDREPKDIFTDSPPRSRELGYVCRSDVRTRGYDLVTISTFQPLRDMESHVHPPTVDTNTTDQPNRIEVWETHN